MDKVSARVELLNLKKLSEELLRGPYVTLFSIWGSKGYWHEPEFGAHGKRALGEFQDYLVGINLSLNVLAGYSDTQSLNSLRFIQDLRDSTLELNTFIKEILDGREYEDLNPYEIKFQELSNLFNAVNFEEVLTSIQKAENKDIYLKKREISQFSTPLYHGVKLQYIKSILQRSSLEVRTTHRYWKDGRRYFDYREENYNNCEWIKGISMTRDFDYAAKWGDVVLVLNWNELKQNLSFLPVAWFRSHPKKEREEFLYFENQKDAYKTSESEGLSREQMEKLQASVGEIPLTEKNFYGFFVRASNYYSDPEWEELTKHPQFLGMYER